MFTLRSVSYITHEHIVILDKLCSVFPKDQLSWVYGSSGSGVSTALRLLARDISPSDGELTIDYPALNLDSDCSDMTYKQCVSAYWPQLTLLDNYNLADNIALPLHVMGAKKQDIRDKTESIMDLFDISSFAALKPRNCPRTIVAQATLARSLIVRPKILLLDRLFCALDQTAYTKVLTILIQLAAHGLTIVVGDDKPPAHPSASEPINTLTLYA